MQNAVSTSKLKFTFILPWLFSWAVRNSCRMEYHFEAEWPPASTRPPLCGQKINDNHNNRPSGLVKLWQARSPGTRWEYHQTIHDETEFLSGILTMWRKLKKVRWYQKWLLGSALKSYLTTKSLTDGGFVDSTAVFVLRKHVHDYIYIYIYIMISRC